MKKDVRIMLVLGLVVGLAAVNFWIFSQPKDFRVCYKDGCIVSPDPDPEEQVRSLIKSDSVVFIIEGDKPGNKTAETRYVDAALARLAAVFHDKEQSYYGIYFEGSKPAGCLNEALNETPLGFCQDFQPDQTTLLIRIRYPVFGENTIFVKGRTIEFRGKSGLDAFALEDALFEPYFFPVRK